MPFILGRCFFFLLFFWFCICFFLEFQIICLSKVLMFWGFFGCLVGLGFFGGVWGFLFIVVLMFFCLFLLLVSRHENSVALRDGYPSYGYT